MLDPDQDSVNPDPQRWESVIIYTFTQNYSSLPRSSLKLMKLFRLKIRSLESLFIAMMLSP
jgi:hypothetical protein